MADEEVVAKIGLNILTDGGVKKLEVPFPSDEQWIKRSKARQILMKPAGRGATETVAAGGEEFDLQLLKDLSGGQNGFTADDASLALNQLSIANVEGVEKVDSGFKVTLRTCAGRSEYILKCPSAKQVRDFRKPNGGFIRVIDLQYGVQEVKTNLEAAGTLFDGLGGLAGTPIIYKVAVVSAVVSEIERLLDPSTENF